MMSITGYLQTKSIYPEYQDRRTGSVYYLCMLHKEQTPSFRVSMGEKGEVWHCYGCRTGGMLQRLIHLYEDVSWGRAWWIMNGDPLIVPKRFIHAPQKVQRTHPATADQRTVLTLLMEWAHRRLLAPTIQADIARKYLIDRGVFNTVLKMLPVGYVPSDPSGRYAQALSDLLDSHVPNGSTIAEELGILKKNNGIPWLCLQNRVLFSCLDLQDPRVSTYYQGRVVPPYEGKPKYIGPKGILKTPFWIPVEHPRIQATIAVESPLGPLVLASHRLLNMATLGNGMSVHFLQHFRSPFLWGQDNDEPIQIRGKAERIQPGEEQAKYWMQQCDLLGIPGYRLLPDRESKGMDEYVTSRGITTLLRDIDALGFYDLQIAV